MAAAKTKKRKPGRPKGSKTKIHRTASKGAKGVLSNPYVASQVGAAIGAALATIHQEDPNAFSRAFDAALPPLISAGREYERRDVLAVLTGKRKKGLKLKELVTLIASGGHVSPLDLKEVKRQLGTQLQFYVAQMKAQTAADADFELRRGNPPKIVRRRRGKKGPRS